MARLTGLCDGGDGVSLVRRREGKVGPGSVGLGNVTVFDRMGRCVAAVFCIWNIAWGLLAAHQKATHRPPWTWAPPPAALSLDSLVFIFFDRAPMRRLFVCPHETKSHKPGKKRKNHIFVTTFLSFFFFWRVALCEASKKLPRPFWRYSSFFFCARG